MKLFLMTGFLAVLIAGCKPSTVSDEVPAGCVPKELTVETGNELMTVFWKPDCSQLISGYYVYISESPLFEKYGNGALPKSVEPFNHTAFAGDTEPEDGIEHFEARGLENGRKYYVSVRTVFPNITLSKSSSEQVAVCGPRGEIELSIRYKGEHDGYSFEKDRFVRADDLANDIYFHSLKGVDYLGSPEKLDGFLRRNRLTVLPFNGERETVRAKTVEAGLKAEELRVPVKVNDWVLIRLEDEKFCLVQITGFSGEGESRKIRLSFALSTVAKELLF
ncbi:MAG: hypothetical protein P1R58_02660 [bacterium]|nr:hypothetical protein [bacterium]